MFRKCDAGVACSCLVTGLSRRCRFTYPARPGAPALSHFSLTIPRGATVALIGESGSGKSTVVALFERFYEPDVSTPGGAVVVMFACVSLGCITVRHYPRRRRAPLEPRRIDVA